MTNPFDIIDQRLERLENLFKTLAEKILSNESIKVTSEKPIKIEDAIEITGYKKGYIYELVFRNAIPYIKIGRSIRFDPLELDTWMRSGSTLTISLNRMWVVRRMNTECILKMVL